MKLNRKILTCLYFDLYINIHAHIAIVHVWFSFTFQFDETSHYTIAFISDKEFFVKAVFSQAAVEQFKR